MPRTNMGKPKELVRIEQELREMHKGARYMTKAQIGRAYSIKNYDVIEKLMAGFPPIVLPSGQRRWKLEDVARMEYTRTVS